MEQRVDGKEYKAAVHGCEKIIENVARREKWGISRAGWGG
jgi:hypothetical protein